MPLPQNSSMRQLICFLCPDYAADLLRKHRIYTESYISKLVVSFKDLLGNKEEQVEKMIFGTTLSESNINQRVFSKLTIDLKKQLNALKSPNY